MRLFRRRWKSRGRERARILAIHGMMAHSGYFEFFGRIAAGKGITVVAPDLRGYGRSGGERGRIGNIYLHLEDIRQLADEEFGDRDFFLLGHSYGSIHAIHYEWFFRDPRVRGLVLASPAFFLKQYPKTVLGFFSIAAKFFSGSRELVDTLSSWTNEQKSIPEAGKVIPDSGCTKSFEPGYMASFFRLQMSAYMKLPSMDKPALFLVGRRDIVISPCSMLLGYLLYGGKKGLVVADTDHTLSYLFSLHQEENRIREMFADEILAWISDQSQNSSMVR